MYTSIFEQDLQRNRETINNGYMALRIMKRSKKQFDEGSQSLPEEPKMSNNVRIFL